MERESTAGPIPHSPPTGGIIAVLIQLVKKSQVARLLGIAPCGGSVGLWGAERNFPSEGRGLHKAKFPVRMCLEGLLDDNQAP